MDIEKLKQIAASIHTKVPRCSFDDLLSEAWLMSQHSEDFSYVYAAVYYTALKEAKNIFPTIEYWDNFTTNISYVSEPKIERYSAGGSLRAKCVELGVSYHAVRYRFYQLGQSLSEALQVKPLPRISTKSRAATSGLHYNTVLYRLHHRGMSVEQALTSPKWQLKK